MSRTEVVESYLRGEISRRTLIRRLAAAGVSLSAAVAYSELLRPEWALAAEQCSGEFYDQYGHYECHYETPPTPTPEPAKEQTPLVTAPTPPPPDTIAPVTGMKVSKLSLAALLLTGRLVVRFTTSEAGSVGFTVTTTVVRGSGAEAARRLTVARGSAKFAAPGTKRVRLKLTRAGRKALLKRRAATLRVTARAVDAAGNARVRVATLKLH